MKKILFLSCALAGVLAQAGTLNPTSPFYTPAKGNALLSGTAEWYRIEDKTTTDTSTDIAGMYGLTDGIALMGGIFDSGVRIPEIGVRFVPCMGDNWHSAVEAQYGFGSYGSDGDEYDYINTKATAAYDFDKLLLGAYGSYKYAYHFSNASDRTHYSLFGMGAIATYSVSDKTTIDADYYHAFNNRTRVKGGYIAREINKSDSLTLSLTHEFKDHAYVTPYVGYEWLDKTNSRVSNGPRDVKVFGINVAVEF